MKYKNTTIKTVMFGLAALLASCSNQVPDLEEPQGSSFTQRTISEEWSPVEDEPTKEIYYPCTYITKTTSSEIVRGSRSYYSSLTNEAYKSSISQKFVTEWSFEGSVSGGFDVALVKSTIGFKATYKVVKEVSFTAAPRTRVTIWRTPIYQKIQGYQVKQCPGQPNQVSYFSSTQGHDAEYSMTETSL